MKMPADCQREAHFCLGGDGNTWQSHVDDTHTTYIDAQPRDPVWAGPHHQRPRMVADAACAHTYMGSHGLGSRIPPTHVCICNTGGLFT